MDYYRPLTSVLDQIASFTVLDDSKFYDCLPINSFYLYCDRAYRPWDVCEDTVPSPEYFDCKVNYHHM